jgi:hypothetical protein
MALTILACATALPYDALFAVGTLQFTLMVYYYYQGKQGRKGYQSACFLWGMYADGRG